MFIYGVPWLEEYSNQRSMFPTQVEKVPQPKNKEKNSSVSKIHFDLCSICFKPLSRQTSIADRQVLTHWDSLLLFLSLIQRKKNV